MKENNQARILQSLKKGNRSNSETPQKDNNEALEQSRSTFGILDNSPQIQKPHEPVPRRSRWDSNIEGIYRNRYLSGQREGSTRRNEQMKSTGYRDQSPPVKDGTRLRLNTDSYIENKENCNINIVEPKTITEPSDLSQVYNIFKYTNKREAKRAQSVSLRQDQNVMDSLPKPRETVQVEVDYQSEKPIVQQSNTLLTQGFETLKKFSSKKHSQYKVLEFE